MKRILLIDIHDRAGGVRTFIDQFFSNLSSQKGFYVQKKYPRDVKLADLFNFDIIHVSVLTLHDLKYIFLPKTILTVHGWIARESREIVKRKKHIYHKLLFLSHRLAWLFILKIKKHITCPTENTARENGILKKAILIPNAVSFDDLQKIKPFNREKLGFGPDDFLMAAYSSIGGNKHLSALRAVSLLNELRLSHKNIHLLVFGSCDHLPESDGLVKMGYSSDFLSILASCDLFLCPKGFPDLGYAEMEAAALKIPILKFCIDYDGKKYEQYLNDDVSILVENNDQATQAIDQLLKNRSKLALLGSNFYNYVHSHFDWNVVIGKWSRLLNNI